MKEAGCVCDMTEAGKDFFNKRSEQVSASGRFESFFFTPKRGDNVWRPLVLFFSNKRHEIIYRCYAKLS